MISIDGTPHAFEAFVKGPKDDFIIRVEADGSYSQSHPEVALTLGESAVLISRLCLMGFSPSIDMSGTDVARSIAEKIDPVTGGDAIKNIFSPPSYGLYSAA